MAHINGKYQLVSNENLVPYLVAYGIPQEKAEKADSLKPVLEVSLDGKKLSLKSDSGVENSSSVLVIGEEVEEKMPLGIALKSVAKVEGNKIIISSTGPKGETGNRVYEFTDKQLVVTITPTNNDKIPVAKRVYKRV